MFHGRSMKVSWETWLALVLLLFFLLVYAGVAVSFRESSSSLDAAPYQRNTTELRGR